MKCVRPKQPGGSIPSFTNSSVTKCCVAMAGDVSRAAQGPILKSTIKEFRSHRGDDSEQNLIALCSACHATVHRM